MIAGVCAGLAKQLELDVTLVRIGFIVLWILGVGIGWIGVPLIYLIMWMLVPANGVAKSIKAAWNLEKKD